MSDTKKYLQIFNAALQTAAGQYAEDIARKKIIPTNIIRTIIRKGMMECYRNYNATFGQLCFEGYILDFPANNIGDGGIEQEHAKSQYEYFHVNQAKVIDLIIADIEKHFGNFFTKKEASKIATQVAQLWIDVYCRCGGKICFFNTIVLSNTDIGSAHNDVQDLFERVMQKH